MRLREQHICCNPIVVEDGCDFTKHLNRVAADGWNPTRYQRCPFGQGDAVPAAGANGQVALRR